MLVDTWTAWTFSAGNFLIISGASNDSFEALMFLSLAASLDNKNTFPIANKLVTMGINQRNGAAHVDGIVDDRE